jgi:hypothetical protein
VKHGEALMKTTLEIPDSLLRQAKAAAARQGIPLRKLVTQAIAARLSRTSSQARPWMKSFGKLRALRKETARVGRLIEREFGRIEAEDLR